MILRPAVILSAAGALAIAACGSTERNPLSFASNLLSGPSAARPKAATVPKATCGPLDRPETGLQGQTPLADRQSGATTQAYNCNLEKVGQFEGEGASWQLTWFDDCAYYDTANNNNPGRSTGDGGRRRLGSGASEGDGLPHRRGHAGSLGVAQGQSAAEAARGEQGPGDSP